MASREGENGAGGAGGDTSAAGEGVVDGGAAQVPVPPPPATTVFPLFDLKKRKELYQKAQPPPPPPQPTRKSKSRAAAPPRSTTPTSSSLSDNDATSTSASNSNSTSTTTTAAKKKKQPATARPKRRPKDDPDGDFSAAKPRARRALVPRKKAVKPLQKDKDKSKDTEKKKEEGGAMAETPFLTPTSSPPAMDCGGGSGSGDDMDVDVDMDEVDLVGRSRRKRRRKTPVDDNVREVAPPSSPAVVAQMGALAVSPRKADAFGVLMGKRSSNAGKVSMAEQEDAEDREGEEEEDEPMLPLGVPEAAAVGARKRIPVSWDSETGMLTIRSSPGLLPSSPALGPVDVLDLAAGSDCEAEGKEGGEGRALRGLGRRKRTTARYDPGTGILSIKSSPILAAESAMDAVPDSDFCLLDYEQPQPQEEEGKELPLPLPLPPPPPHQQGESQAETSQPENTAKRTSAKYDTATGLLVISSPVLGPVKTPELRPKSAFSLLGKKKKEPPPPPQSAPAISAPQTAAAAPAQEPLPTVTVRQAPKKVAGSQTGKSVHPFFKPGGIKKVPDPPPLPQSDAEEEVTTATSQPQPARSAPTTTTLSAFATTAKIAAPWDTPWPTRANNHIRALPSTPLLLPPGIDIDAHLQPADRKRKERAVVVSGAEDLLHQLARTLRVPRVAREVADRDYYTRRYYDVPEHVRLPARIVMTGSELQSIVRGRVASRLPHPNAPRPRPQDDGREKGGMGAGKVHPALLKLYWRLQSELTPFDVSECETSCWEVKYAPECAAEVLQTGRETQVLRDWLRALKVESVAPAAAAHAGSRAVKRKTRGVKGGAVAKKRRRRKEAELSDFVIDSEEERDEMNEISDAEESNSGGGGGGVFGVKRSTIRAGDKGIECPFGGPKELGRLVNAVVISGPSGCGKTAAVYAVAREAGFEVFEVSPGMRRNGKDIVDQVGEMSRTHLVHQAKAAAPEAGAFFKPKTAAQKEKLDEEAAAAGGTKAPAQQQQSLILIEEADVLFDEDKNFWSSVQTLMAQSKRPIVFTCNDESLLPISSLSLHAVLRFTPPPRDLLVDNLMLVCANEGHLLERGSVHSLVVAKGDDMRAALVELEFWCRLGLGDRKGGLDWMVMRWPEGVDVAANGERMRVVSEGTYLEGMGAFDRAVGGEQRRWRNAWEMWGVDVGAADGGEELAREMCAAAVGEGMDVGGALRTCEEYAEALSAVDVYAGAAMRGFDELFMDSTQPPPSAKARTDDLQGHPTLREAPLDRIYTVDTDMATAVRYLAKRHLYGARYTALGDSQLVQLVTQRGRNRQALQPLSPHYLAETFRPLTYASTIFANSPAIVHSAVNRAPGVLVLDVAPYVRGIVRHDARQAEMRVRASGLLSAGGGGGGGRVTRTARNAGEGGDRRRRDRWLGVAGVEVGMVVGSGGVGWGAEEGEGEEGDVDVDGVYDLEEEELD